MRPPLFISVLMILIPILIILSAIVYCICILACVYAWNQKTILKTDQIYDRNNCAPLSLVIALHNEEKSIARLLHSVSSQSLPFSEVIIVLDHCTDNTSAIAKKTIRDLSMQNVSVVDNDGFRGKKHAQRKGVELSINNYVAVIDGDCVAEKGWAKALAAEIVKSTPDIIIAPVSMLANDSRISQRLMELEFLSLQMVTAGTALLAHPTMCNGANMAFRKDVYLSHDGNNQFVSGDDMFLLGSVKHRNGKISYLKSPDALVSTTCPVDNAAYFRQRTRWLRKSTGYTDWDVKCLSVIVLLGNMSWPMAFLLGSSVGCVVAGFCFVLKSVSELILIMSGCKYWGIRFNVAFVLLLALVYPFVLFAIAFKTVFRDKSIW